MSGSTGNVRPSTERAARVERLKAAVANRKQEQEPGDAGKPARRRITGSKRAPDAKKRRTS